MYRRIPESLKKTSIRIAGHFSMAYYYLGITQILFGAKRYNPVRPSDVFLLWITTFIFLVLGIPLCIFAYLIGLLSAFWCLTIGVVLFLLPPLFTWLLCEYELYLQRRLEVTDHRTEVRWLWYRACSTQA